MALRLLRLSLAAIAPWVAAMLVYAGPGNDGVRRLAAGVVTICALLFVGAPRIGRIARVATLAYLGCLLAAFGWWTSLVPSNDRAWQPEVAVLPWAVVDGDRVTLHGVRHFAYRSETEFTPRWEDRTVDLRALDEIDLIASYWMGPKVAHTLLSFGFGGEFVAISIETRKEIGEGYSPLAGFFRQYELYYVVADERDVIGVRTTHRHDPPEDVYLYRLRGTRENARKVFLDYLRAINALHETPGFYNSLTTNCTTALVMHGDVVSHPLPRSWKALVSGFLPSYLYERGVLDTTVPFEELQRRSRINAAAQAAGDAPDFSARIRAGLPWPAPAR